MTLPFQRLFLIGYRGTGKTSTARVLAARLGWQFRDADTYLEQQAGRTIRAIFATDGETCFRDLESAALAELAQLECVVIATGGGVIIRSENRSLLKRTGCCVWLQADPDTIGQRLQADIATAAQRPALTHLGGLAEIRTLLAQREPWYRECAALAVDTVGRSPEDVAEIILAELARVGA
jgi:shikimate kinase